MQPGPTFQWADEVGRLASLMQPLQRQSPVPSVRDRRQHQLLSEHRRDPPQTSLFTVIVRNSSPAASASALEDSVHKTMGEKED